MRGHTKVCMVREQYHRHESVKQADAEAYGRGCQSGYKNCNTESGHEKSAVHSPSVDSLSSEKQSHREKRCSLNQGVVEITAYSAKLKSVAQESIAIS